jgi:hypothetical protein
MENFWLVMDEGINNNENAAVRGVEQRIYRDVLEFENVVRLHRTRNNLGLFHALKNLRKECLWRSQWPSDLRRGYAVARLLGLRVRIPQVARMSDCGGCCVMSVRSLCDGPITYPEESY